MHTSGILEFRSVVLPGDESASGTLDVPQATQVIYYSYSLAMIGSFCLRQSRVIQTIIKKTQIASGKATLEFRTLIFYPILDLLFVRG